MVVVALEAKKDEKLRGHLFYLVTYCLGDNAHVVCFALCTNVYRTFLSFHHLHDDPAKHIKPFKNILVKVKFLKF
jgi:hypothetical protein